MPLLFPIPYYYIVLLLVVLGAALPCRGQSESSAMTMSRSLERMALCYMQGQRDSALSVGLRLLPQAEAAADTAAQMNICLVCGLALREQNRDSDALEMFSRGAALGEACDATSSEGRRQLTANLLMNLANVCYDLDRRGECPGYARRAARIAMTLDQRDLHAMVLPYAGRLLLVTGHRHEAVPLLTKGLEAARHEGLADQQLLCLSMLAQAEDEEHQPAPADNHWLQQASSVLAQAADPFVVGTYHEVAGRIKMRAGRLGEASEDFAQIVPSGALDHVTDEDMKRIVGKVEAERQERDSLAEAYKQVQPLVGGYRRTIVWALTAVAVIVLAFAVYALWQRRQRRRGSERSRQQAEQRYMDGMERERRRMARELHDGVANDLLALQMRLDSEGLTPETMQQLNDSREQVRRVSHDLLPPEFELVSLSSALGSYAAKTDGVGGCRVSFVATPADDDTWRALAPRLALDAYRIAQEAVANALKHAAATTIAIGLHRKADGTVMLTVSDDGRNASQTADKQPTGIGTTTMRQRAAAMGGSLSVVSHAFGTTLSLTFHAK